MPSVTAGNKVLLFCNWRTGLHLSFTKMGVIKHCSEGKGFPAPFLEDGCQWQPTPMKEMEKTASGVCMFARKISSVCDFNIKGLRSHI
ncbi:hypothetical protein TNIN_167891 [Trichonephila inaurata madagascariensis]|uniref:Uncharacterized protein n=1 Tax=Trichonephila inaurata madagascariensis TaxID=2747483 RepID=A0A8X6IRG3_9ARAC|nr:hypothetical protein TNIN_167891 [Trichonephila inaurata madagascariensis]